MVTMGPRRGTICSAKSRSFCPRMSLGICMGLAFGLLFRSSQIEQNPFSVSTGDCPVCPSLVLGHQEIEASSRSKYWDMRKNSPLYHKMVEIARTEATFALTALDVGSYESPFLSRFDWIPTKIATDIQPRPQVWNDVRGIAFIQGDFMNLQFGTTFDLVLCSQVVEHLPDEIVIRFISKMAGLSRVLIVSTSYEMPTGTIDGHVQDPISEEKFRSWFAKSPGGELKSVVKVPSSTKLVDPSDGVAKQATNIVGTWKRS